MVLPARKQHGGRRRLRLPLWKDIKQPYQLQQYRSKKSLRRMVLLLVIVTALFLLQVALHAKSWARSYFFQRLLDTDTTGKYPLHNDQADFAIFYHIYIPHNNNNTSSGDNNNPQRNALRIIDEQMHQIGKSYAANAATASDPNKPNQPTKLYYNTIGAPNVVTETFMNQYCGGDGLYKYNLDCVHLQHRSEGMETMTLTSVYDYCQQHDQPPQQPNNDNNVNNRRAIYLHNKGSFHENPINEQWRRLMTYSVTTEQCLHPPTTTTSTSSSSSNSNNNTDEDEPNVCGLYFIAERGLFMPGNFWTAKCDYINRLLPPLEFERRSTEIMKDALLMHLEHRFEMDLFNFVEDNYGVDRYADELWIGSHPTLRPSDWALHKRSNFGFGHGDPFFEWLLGIWDPFQMTWKNTMEWTLSPSLPMKLPFQLWDSHWVETTAIQKQRHAKRLREFTLLGGNLYKWIHLYGQVPPPQSWIWSWFPDGDFWKNALAVHGDKAVEVVTTEQRDNYHNEFMDPNYAYGYRRIDEWCWLRPFHFGF